MKIMFASNNYLPVRGGSLVMYHNILRHLTEDEVTVITRSHPEAEMFDSTQALKITRCALPIRLASKVPYGDFLTYGVLGFQAIRWALVLRPDILHCGGLIDVGLPALFLNQIIRLPYCLYLHGEELTTMGRLRHQSRLIFPILRKAGRIFVNSGFTRRKVEKHGIAPQKIVQINPGLDHTVFHQDVDGEDIRLRHGLNGRQTLLTVGRLVERKGHDMVLRSLSAVMERFPNIVYLIVGQGENEGTLRKLTRDLGLESAVEFAGLVAQEDLPKYYAAADLFVMPNRESADGAVEGFGMVFLEASACGTPVIGGLSGGTEDAIRQGKTGLLVDPWSEEAVSSAILELLGNTDRAKAMGDEGAQWAHSKHFRYESIAQIIQEASRAAIHAIDSEAP